ncbi:MAG: hypothetical protein RXR03_07355 [Thermocladium sp.]|jgi:hypothetical protein|nr:MAG: hypothetical protein AT710_06965 [Thermocladium sp. ECH_B]
MLLILINTNYEDALSHLLRDLGDENALAITNDAIITWKSRASVERGLMSLKEKIISKVSGEGDVEFSYALIELSDDQLGSLRTMIRDALVRLDRETYRHIDSIRNRLDRISEKRLETEMKFLNKRFNSLMLLHNKFKVMTPDTEKMIDLMRELRIMLGKKR